MATPTHPSQATPSPGQPRPSPQHPMPSPQHPGIAGPGQIQGGPVMALPPPAGVKQPSQQQTASPTKEVNMTSLCRAGQELIQDTVQKATDLFNFLKATPLPNGTTNADKLCQDRKEKIAEFTRSVGVNMLKLHIIYDRVKEATAPLETGPIENVLPIEENGEVGGEPTRLTDAMRVVSKEHREIIEQIRVRNAQVKSVIDQLRLVIWEINTMMVMRR